MADPNVNTNPNLKSLPGKAGNFFAGINARIRDADRKARDEAEGRLLSEQDKSMIANLRTGITRNLNEIRDNKDRLGINSKLIQGLMEQTDAFKTEINNILKNNNFEEKYANLQNEKRISRKRQREPSSVQVPSDEDMVKASEEAETALAAADELLTETDEELPLPPTTVQPAIPTPTPPTEPDSANANKLAKVLVDSLVSTATPSIAEELEADMPAPLTVTEKPQPTPAIETAQVQAQQEPIITPSALANVIINALKLASTAPVLVPEPIPVPEPVAKLEPVPKPEPVLAAVPEPEPEPVQTPATTPITQEPTILPSALANVIVNALKLASSAQRTQEQIPTILPGALAEPETVQSTIAPATVAPETVAPETVAGDKCGESPGFISLIQKYLEPIIGQFAPPETKPQKVFDKTQLPENMQRILDDASIRYIGRYRTESKPDQNAVQQQTTYLFWDTSTHDYTSHTVTDVVNDVMVKPAPPVVPAPVVPAPVVPAPVVPAPVVPAPVELAPTEVTAPKLTKAQKAQKIKLAKAEKEQKEKETEALVKQLPEALTTKPVTQQQSPTPVKIGDREIMPLGPMI